MLQQKQQGFIAPVPDFYKQESQQSLKTKLRQSNADKHAFGLTKLNTPGDRPTDRNSFKKSLGETKEENKQAKSPLGVDHDNDFKLPIKASPRQSIRVPQGMQRGFSETSFQFPLNGLNTTPNRIQNDFFKLGNEGGNMLGLPRVPVPPGFNLEHSNFSTTSLDKQLKEVDSRRGQFTTTGATSGNHGGFGDCSLLTDFLGNNAAKM